MRIDDIDAVLADVLRHRRLLDHPFYRRWEAGTLAPGELADYAAQYRHFEAALPTVLASLADRLRDPQARRLVLANLDDERRVPAPHIELFQDFARAVGAPPRAEPQPATSALLGVYESADDEAATAAVATLAALAAYEVQAAGIAASKAAGLRERYGLDDNGVRFWDVHAGTEESHGAWLVEAIAAEGAEAATLERAAAEAADAWWAFLDERELGAPVPATA